MPSAPAFTIAEAAYQTAGPADTFVLRPNGHPASILDTVFVSRRLRRAVYATTTIKGVQTDLWRVERSGRLTLVANIRWEYEWQTPTVTAAGDGSLKTVYGPVRKVPAVCFAARIWKVDEFLRKSRGWFPSDSRLFTAGDTEYKWKSGTENSSTNDGQHDRSSTRAYHEPWKIWRCVAVNSTAVHKSSPSYSSLDTNLQQETPTTGPSNLSTVADPHIHQSPRHMPSIDSFTVAQDLFSPSTSSVRARLAPVLAAPAPPTILARFAPPQLGLTHHELALFPSAFSSADPNQNQFLVESLLLSAVLLAVNKGEWKNVQSAADKDALEAVFIAEARGEVPPYTTRVGQAIRPPIPQRDHIQTQSDPIPRLDAFGMNYERPRTAPARQLDLQQTQSRLDPELRTGRQLHRTFHSIPNRGEFPLGQSHPFAYSPPSSSQMVSAPPVSFRIRRPSTSGSNRSERTTRAGDGIFAGRRPSRSRSRPSTGVGLNEEAVLCPLERQNAISGVSEPASLVNAGGIGSSGHGRCVEKSEGSVAGIGEMDTSSSCPPPSYFRSIWD